MRLDKNSDLAERIVPRIPIEHVVDTTGADVVRRRVGVRHLQDADIVRVPVPKQRWARNAAPARLDVYLSLPQTNKQLADTYGTAFEELTSHFLPHHDTVRST